MSDSRLILLCDHRGEGLSETLRPLRSVGLRIEESTSLGQTREFLQRLQPDLLLLDPLSSGGVVEFEQVSAARGKRTIPVLVVADPADPLPTVTAAQILSESPWDMIYRDAPLEEYLMRIERLSRQADGQRELCEMRFQAVHDDRTALLRPIPFQTRLREHFSAAHRHHFDLALVLLDLDRFGLVNKEFDHTVGDAVIDRVGRVVRENLRTEDVGGRLGGDEFAIVLPYTQRVDAARVVHRLRDQVQALTGPVDGFVGEVQVSASIGFETFDGRDLESVETLRRHGEMALRCAKEHGGNRAIYYRQIALAGDAPRAEAAGE